MTDEIRHLVQCATEAGALETSNRELAISGPGIRGTIHVARLILIIVLATILGLLGCESPLEGSSGSEGI
jgi:hypothetical protein